jgi:hypothetical protein
VTGEKLRCETGESSAGAESDFPKDLIKRVGSNLAARDFDDRASRRRLRDIIDGAKRPAFGRLFKTVVVVAVLLLLVWYLCFAGAPVFRFLAPAARIAAPILWPLGMAAIAGFVFFPLGLLYLWLFHLLFSEVEGPKRVLCPRLGELGALVGAALGVRGVLVLEGAEPRGCMDAMDLVISMPVGVALGLMMGLIVGLIAGLILGAVWESPQ